MNHWTRGLGKVIEELLADNIVLVVTADHSTPAPVRWCIPGSRFLLRWWGGVSAGIMSFIFDEICRGQRRCPPSHKS